MARTPGRLFSSLRACARVCPARSRTRRMMSSESHAGHPSSDTPWMIGSALVFGPLFLYLLSPSGRTGSGHGDTGHGHKNDRDVIQVQQVQQIESRREEDVRPIADDEGTEVSGQDVNESMEKAFEADSPKDAQEREEVVAKAEATPDEDSSASGTSPDVAPTSPTDTTLVPEPSPAQLSDAVITDAAPVVERAQSTAEATQPAAESKV